MTKKMYDDLIKDLRRKNKWLIVGLVCVLVLLIIMSVVAFSCFEFSYEYVEDKDTNIEQNAGDGGGEVNQNVDMSEKEETDKIRTICGAVTLCVLIIVIGVCVHGKSKNNNTEKKDGEDND